MGDSLIFDIDAVTLENIENPEVAIGWQPAPDRIIHSTTGYGTESIKSAITKVKNHNGTFQIVDEKTAGVVYQGKIENKTTSIGSFQTIDFTDFKKEGLYRIKVGNIVTEPFYINRNIC